MEFTNAVARAWAEYPPSWDLTGWSHQTDLACTQEERDAIHEYGFDLQRRATEIAAAAQDRRDTADTNDERVEATDRAGAPAQESSAPPSSRAFVFAHGSSKKPGVIPKQQPQPTQMADREDQQLVLMEGERKGEEQ